MRHILRGRDSNKNSAVVGISAQTLNDHYATISTDHSYIEPRAKLTAAHDSSSLFSELEVFLKLDSLRPTATGLDAIPAWFLRVGAPAFAAPLPLLLNQSMSAGVVPKQWKAAAIRPVPKTTKPVQCSEFRPISVTPVLSRLTVTGMFSEADNALFRRILYNKSHVLHTFLPDRPQIVYSLRTITHNKSLICKTSDLNERNFIVRSLYKDCY